MRKITLGSSGEKVSVLSLGALPFGTKVDQTDSYALLDRYFDAGGSFLDTANNYSLWHNNGKGGESETVLGNWMKDRGNRSSIFLASKAGFNTPEIGPSLSRQTIIGEVEKSLKRLQTDYIDLFYAHTDVRDDDLEETLETFNTLVAQGRIRHIGCSNYRAWRIQKALDLSRVNNWASYCCVQQRYTFLRPKPAASFGAQTSANDDLLDFCKETPEVRLLAYSPLLNGSYSAEDRQIPEQYHSVEMETRLQALKATAEQLGATVNQVIYAWMLQSDPAIIPLVAPTKMSQMEENLACLDLKLSPEQMEGLNR